jgi:hypothetical protein
MISIAYFGTIEISSIIKTIVSINSLPALLFIVAFELASLSKSNGSP